MLRKQHALLHLDRRGAHNRSVHLVRLEHQSHPRLLLKLEKFAPLQYRGSVHILAMLRFPILECLVLHIVSRLLDNLREGDRSHHQESLVIPPMLHEYA